MKQKKSKFKKFFFRTVVLAIAGLILGISVYQWNSENLLGNKMPMPFGYGLSVVLSGSMEPVLSTDDLVLIRKSDEYKLNDVVVYQSGDSLVIHRIIEINDDEYITKGDANNMADSPITKDSVKGKLIFSVPAVGSVVKLLRRPSVAILTIVLALVLVELSNRKEKQNDREELDRIQKEIEILLKEMKQ